MSLEVVVPAVGESVSKGTLSSWLKSDGGPVTDGEDLFELETDKATLAVPSPASGVLRVVVAQGSEVTVGQVVARIETAAGAAPAAGPVPVAATGMPSEPSAGSPQVAAKAPDAGSPQFAGGESNVSVPRSETDRGTAADRETRPPAPGMTFDAGRTTRRVKMSAIRRRTAEKMVLARRDAAHLTTFNEIDMTRVAELRKSHGEAFEERHGVRLGFMSFFVKACCEALKAFPAVNASIDGDDIVYNDVQDVGVAVSTERGLLVPVLRNADRMSFPEIERAIRSFAERARDKKLSPDELVGGTFTITNGGVFGSLLSTPIPNPPQTAILGMHAIQNRPVALGERVVVRPMMYVALTYDHRLIDGREAVGFLVKVKQLVEDPLRFLLDV
jgi:2-oxoglutarate dehydrogenase E2 component (dihydrolipoamide succinyltransferase)